MSNRTLLITTCLRGDGCEEEELRAIPPATIQSTPSAKKRAQGGRALGGG